MIKNICVYCSASDHLDKIYFQAAKELGKLIGINDFSLVYGAGATGLMGAVSRSVYQYDGKIIGVIPKALDLDHIAHRDSDEFIVTNTLRERKEIMDQRSDAFIALPGGYGTLEELLEIITLKQLEYHKKPIVILNINNFYSKLIAQFENLIAQQFAHQNHANLYTIVQTPQEAINYILNDK
jgi:uncharacterized protein (TIGR00730 family)